MEKYKVDETLFTMTIKNFIWGLIGITLGLVVNYATKMVNSYQNMFQLVACSFILAFIQIQINPMFGWSWQNITPGLFFVSFFFGTQFSMFENLQKIFIKK